MKWSPFLSIVIPVYNSQDYLAECLDSIIYQSFTDYEVIVINDGSTDNSLSICNSYKSKIHKLKVIDKKNEGASVARNVGIKNAIGDYIWFIDSDDHIPNKHVFNTLKHNTKNTKIDILGFSNYIYIVDEKKTIKDQRVNNTSIMSPKEFVSDINRHVRITPWIVIFRNIFLKENDILFDQNLIISEDVLFMHVCISKAKTIKYIPDYLYTQKWRENSLSSKSVNRHYILKAEIALLKLSQNAVNTTDFEDFWYTKIYDSYIKIYFEYYNLKEGRNDYKNIIKSMKKKKLLLRKKDVFGIKVLKTLHNYCFPIYKLRILGRLW